MTSQQAYRTFREATKRVSHSTTVALWSCYGVAAGLLIASFIVPPHGVIDASVLKGTAELLAFAGIFLVREAIREGLGVKLTHGQTTIEVHDLDGIPSDDEEIKTDENDD